MSKLACCVHFIFLVPLMTLCSGPRTDKIDNEKIQAINIDRAFNVEENRNLSEIARDYKWVKLETTEDCFISQIEKVFITDRNILVFDRVRSNVFVFDLNGRFLNRIGRTGKGPGEYVKVNIVCVDNNDFCYLWDYMSHNLLRFSISGEYIKSKHYDIALNEIEYIDKDHLVLFMARKYSDVNDYFQIAIVDSSLNLSSRLFSTKNNRDMDWKEYLGRFSLYHFGGKVCYWEGYRNDTVYEICSSHEVIGKFILDYDCDKMPYSIYKDYKKHNENMHMAKITEVFETKSKLFVKAIVHGREINSIIDKENGGQYHLSSLKDWERRILDYNDVFMNDIDGGMPFWPRGVGTSNENIVFCWYDMVTIKQYLNERERRSTLKADNHLCYCFD